MGPRRDVGLAERVSSANSGLVRPSPPFCSHPGHCSTIPGCGSPTQQDITIPVVVHPLAFCQLRPQTSIRTVTRAGGAHTTTLEAALGQAEDSPRRPPGARFIRTTTNSTALYAILARFPPSPRYWHFASIKPQGPGGFASSPAMLVAPSASTTVQRNTLPRNQDKTRVSVLLSAGH
jgi:hypothetical protein